MLAHCAIDRKGKRRKKSVFMTRNRAENEGETSLRKSISGTR